MSRSKREKMKAKERRHAASRPSVPTGDSSTESRPTRPTGHGRTRKNKQNPRRWPNLTSRDWLWIGLALIAEDAAFEHRLPEISVPTLLLFGAHDKVAPPGNADLMADKIPGSQIAIIPDAGHFFSIETPEPASRMIVDLLQQEV